jgi:hypothetical protein
MPPTILVPRYRRRDRLDKAFMAYQPGGFWPGDDGAGPLRDLTGRWPAAVTGSPTYRSALPSPVRQGISWGASPYATTSTSVPNPATSLSVVACLRTATATASGHTIVARSDSWEIRLSAGHLLLVSLYNTVAGVHAQVVGGVAENNGALKMVALTFDGTTLRTYITSGGAITAASSASLTGTWKAASAAAITIAALGTSFAFDGVTSKHLYLPDRVLSSADVASLASIVFGG